MTSTMPRRHTLAMAITVMMGAASAPMLRAQQTPSPGIEPEPLTTNTWNCSRKKKSSL